MQRQPSASAGAAAPAGALAAARSQGEASCSYVAVSSPHSEQWQLAWLAAQASLPPPPGSSPPPWRLRVLRSAQVDAQRLDVELTSLIKEQFMRIFQHVRPGRVAALEPELAALLGGLVYGLSLFRSGATPGSQLLNLRYRDERRAGGSGQGAAAGGAKGGGGPTADGGGDDHHHHPVHAFGGKTGAEGPGLTRGQKALLLVGYVVVPYVWARFSRLAAAAQWSAATASPDSYLRPWGNSSSGSSGAAPDRTDANGDDSSTSDARTTSEAAAAAAVAAAGGAGRSRVSPATTVTYVRRALAGASGQQARQLLLSRAWRLMRWLAAAYRVASLVNFLVFLKNGVYRYKELK